MKNSIVFIGLLILMTVVFQVTLLKDSIIVIAIGLILSTIIWIIGTKEIYDDTNKQKAIKYVIFILFAIVIYLVYKELTDDVIAFGTVWSEFDISFHSLIGIMQIPVYFFLKKNKIREKLNDNKKILLVVTIVNLLMLGIISLIASNEMSYLDDSETISLLFYSINIIWCFFLVIKNIKISDKINVVVLITITTLCIITVSWVNISRNNRVQSIMTYNREFFEVEKDKVSDYKGREDLERAIEQYYLGLKKYGITEEKIDSNTVTETTHGEPDIYGNVYTFTISKYNPNGFRYKDVEALAVSNIASLERVLEDYPTVNARNIKEFKNTIKMMCEVMVVFHENITNEGKYENQFIVPTIMNILGILTIVVTFKFSNQTGKGSINESY